MDHMKKNNFNNETLKELEKCVKNIEEQIMFNKLEDALLNLKFVFEEIADNSLVDETILAASRLQNFMSKSNLGVVDYFDKEFIQIRYLIINLKSSANNILNKYKSIDFYKPPTRLDNVIFEDNFTDNRNNWGLGEFPSSLSIIKKNRLFIESFNEGHHLWQQVVKIDTNNNFHIKCRITCIDVDSECHYGIHWGGNALDEVSECFNFRFSVTTNGMFYIHCFISTDEIITSRFGSGQFGFS